MDILIWTETGGEADESELRSLLEWLRQERPAPGRFGLRQRQPKPGFMGAATDALQVAVGTGGAATVLAGSVVAWVRTRRPGVRLKLRRPNGEELEIEGQTNDADALIERFLDLAKDG
jgi:hypothetical protein